MEKVDQPHVKERQIQVRRKNGDKYVYRRWCRYEPQKGYEVILREELIGKIPNGATEMVPTRPKRKSSKTTQAEGSRIKEASRTRSGAVKIADFIGKKSEIFKAVKNSFAESGQAPGNSAKFLSIATYWFCTGGKLPRMENWQTTHETPYDCPINVDVYERLFNELGKDETTRQRLFANLMSICGEHPLLAFDSTTVSTYSDNQTLAEYGYNKEGDGLKAIKQLSLFSSDNLSPVAFDFAHGNVPDCALIDGLLKQLDCFAKHRPEIICDKGFYSQDNMLSFLRRHYKFLMPVKTNLSWVQEILNSTPEEQEAKGRKVSQRGETVRQSLNLVVHASPIDPDVKGLTVSGMFTFSWPRKRSRGEKKAGELESEEHRLYIHVFRDENKARQEAAILSKELDSLATRLERGETDFKPGAQKLIKDFLVVTKNARDRVTNVELNAREMERRRKDMGIIVLVSNEEKDAYRALEHYRYREHIEESYKAGKSGYDARRPHCWTEERLRGREMVRQIAIGMDFSWHRELKRVIARAEEIANDENALKKTRTLAAGVATWVKEHSSRQILDWFDCDETVKVKTTTGAKRWSSVNVMRDKLFLDLLFENETVTGAAKEEPTRETEKATGTAPSGGETN